MSNDPNDAFSEQRRERPQPPAPAQRSSRRFEDYDDRPPARRAPSGGGGGAVKVIFIVLGVVLLVTLLCGGGLVGLMFFSVGKVRQAASRAASSNNMMQMSLAFHNHHDVTGHMPASILTKDGKPGLSWRVAILPYVEQDYLYRQFKLDEPWDSPNNIRLLDQMPRIYMNPRMAHPPNQTSYRVFVGKGAMFEHGKKTKLNAFGKRALDEIFVDDGASNTIMIVEATETVPWTKPDELVFDPNGSLPPLGPPGDKVFVVALADTSIRSIPTDTPAANIKAWITVTGGEPVLPP